MSATFHNVYSSSKAFFLLQRAIEILRVERSKNNNSRLKHVEKLKKIFDSSYTVLGELENLQANEVNEAFGRLSINLADIKSQLDFVKFKILDLDDKGHNELENPDLRELEKRMVSYFVIFINIMFKSQFYFLNFLLFIIYLF
jgi:hypothetical protein